MKIFLHYCIFQGLLARGPIDALRRPADSKLHKPRRYKIPRAHFKPVREDVSRGLEYDDLYYSEAILQAYSEAGMDVSHMRLAENVEYKDRGLANYAKWTHMDSMGRTCIPFSFAPDFTSDERTLVKSHLERMSNDIGCINFLYVDFTDDEKSHENGIVFVNGEGCFSALGFAPKFLNPEKYGAPPNWQIISLSEECLGTSSATTMHEVMHALGTCDDLNFPQSLN